MECIGTNDIAKLKMYRKIKEDLIIGEANIKQIIYTTWDNKFYYACIITEGLGNWERLKPSVFEKFGEGRRLTTNISTEQYLWDGDIINMILEYNKISEMGILDIRSEQIEKQKDEYDKQKAKEGAEKDF